MRNNKTKARSKNTNNVKVRKTSQVTSFFLQKKLGSTSNSISICNFSAVR